MDIAKGTEDVMLEDGIKSRSGEKGTQRCFCQGLAKAFESRLGQAPIKVSLRRCPAE